MLRGVPQPSNLVRRNVSTSTTTTGRDRITEGHVNMDVVFVFLHGCHSMIRYEAKHSLLAVLLQQKIRYVLSEPTHHSMQS